MDKFMNGNIRFERGIQAPDGIHEGIEKNEYNKMSNGWALALVTMSMLFVAVCLIAGLLWWVDA